MERLDTLVIGTGAAGQTVAAELAEAGLAVAITDDRPYGGTCALRGCEPKKALYSAADAVHRARTTLGVTGAATLDWPVAVAFKRTLTGPVTDSVERYLTDAGVKLLHGGARFTSAGTVEVGGVAYAPDHVVIATGAVPAPLPFPGAKLVIDSEALMELDALPARILFIGGGYISFEFAHIAAAAGSQVTIVHRSNHVLGGFDPDLTALLAASYRKAGIEVRTGSAVTGVRESADAQRDVVLADGHSIACDLVVHGAGRIPALGGLGLDTAGVAHGPRGVVVDRSMRSPDNPRVFAIGDAAAEGPPLTPVAIAQARVAAAVILGDDKAVFTPLAIPSVVFSDPPLASVGLGEHEAHATGRSVVVHFNDTSGWTSSRRVGVRTSAAKVLVDGHTDEVLGMHLLGHHAEEVINVGALAIATGTTATDLKTMLWAYPTAGSDLVYLLG